MKSDVPRTSFDTSETDSGWEEESCYAVSYETMEWTKTIDYGRLIGDMTEEERQNDR